MGLSTQDKRYDAFRQFDGEIQLRFAGDLVRNYPSLQDAEAAAQTHEIHGFNKSKWELIARLDSVMWLKKGKEFRIVYGADIRETKNDVQAAHWFGECVRHELECNGVM